MKSREKICQIADALSAAGIDAAAREAEIMALHVLHIDRTALYRDDPELSMHHLDVLDAMVKRRSAREPIQYIVEQCSFFGLELRVGQGVLIPRPETELMAEQAVQALRVLGSGGKEKTVLDLCTGSGCLALSLARAFPGTAVIGSDISEAALRYAVGNRRANQIENAVFFRGSLFEPIAPTARFDMILSNPPYIRSGDIPLLQKEITEWEPYNALDGGSDGLTYYKKIIPGARNFLKDHGILMLELGADSAQEVSKMLRHSGYSGIEFAKDYAGIERIALARWIK